MLTAEDFVAMGAKSTPATEGAPKIVYVTKPNSPGSGVIGVVLFIAIILALLSGAGSLLNGLNVPHVATAIQTGAQRLIATPVVAAAPAPLVPPAPIPPAALPTAAVVVPPVPAANAVVIPQGQPQIATATALPPTAVPTAVSAETQAVYNALYVKPTAIPMQACEAGSETYVTTPVKVLNVKHWPIGEVRGRSCVSDQEAHDNATKLSQELMDKDKALHPENWK